MEIKKGLEGVAVDESSICWVDGDEGKIWYSGYDIDDLARNSSYEELLFLLWNGRLPTADLLGTGWLFVLVKLAVAAAIVVLLADYVAEEPVEGNLLVVLVAAVGTGPAANNLTLFLVGGATP